METVQLIKIIVKKLKEKGHTVIVTSHILESLTGICDSISYLHNKRIEQVFYPEDYDSIEKSLFDSMDDRYLNQISGILG